MDRKILIASITDAVKKWKTEAQTHFKTDIIKSLRNRNESELNQLLERMDTTGNEWGFHSFDPVARQISRKIQELLLEEGSALLNSDVLDIARQQPVIFLGNHLSYIDANLMDFLLNEAGHHDIAKKLTVLVGPKVFTLPIRRFASLCFSTIKLAQSPSRASGDAVMPRRKVAKLAYETLATAQKRQNRGDHLLIFVEGSRSRSGGMQRILSATVRYLDNPGTIIIPFGLWGTEQLMPIKDNSIYRSKAMIHLGMPIDASDLIKQCQNNRMMLADTIGYLISDLLPTEYQGVYQGHSEEMMEARNLATQLNTRRLPQTYPEPVTAQKLKQQNRT